MSEESLDKLREEHARRLLSRYEHEAGKFNKLFSGFIAFGLIFFFFALLPYTSIQMEKHAVRNDLEQMRTAGRARTAGLARGNKLLDGLQRLRQAIDQGPARLRNFLLTLAGEGAAGEGSEWPRGESGEFSGRVEQSRGASGFGEPCANPDRDAYLNCLVNRETRGYLEEYRRILQQDILPYSEALNPVLPGLSDAQVMEKAFSEFADKLRQHLEENPDFWKTHAGKGRLFRLDPAVQTLWTEQEKHLSAWVERVSRELEQLQRNTARLEQVEKALAAHEQQLTDRVKQLESPLGKLPMGMTEAILVFPLVVMTGFLLYTNAFCASVRPRREYIKLYRAKDSGGALLDNYQLSLVIPLWLDPLAPGGPAASRKLLFFLPIPLYLLSCGLIAHLWQFPEAFQASGYLNRWFYGGLYLAGLLLLLHNARRVGQLLEEPEPASPDLAAKPGT